MGNGPTEMYPPEGQHIDEGWKSKLWLMKCVVLATAMQIVIFIFCILISSDSGMLITIGGVETAMLLPSYLLLALIVAYLIVFEALNNTLLLYTAHRLISKSGVSIAMIGFYNSSNLRKLEFSSWLPYLSQTRSLTFRISLIWWLQLFSVWMPVYICSKMSVGEIIGDTSKASCVIYEEIDRQTDRGWPTLETAVGCSEFQSEPSLGEFRHPEQNISSKFVLGPQLIDTLEPETILYGNGYTSSIFSNCDCSVSASEDHLAEVGLKRNIYSDAIELMKTLDGSFAFINAIALDSPEMIHMTTIITGTSICLEKKSLLVCQTDIYDHYHVSVKQGYATDGTPASIALVNAKVEKIGARANITWLRNGISKVLKGDLSVFKLPSTYAGSISTILWRASVNLQAVSLQYLPRGLEFFFAAIMRAGIMRTYTATGTKCTQLVIEKTISILQLTHQGKVVFMIYVCIEIFIVLLALAICIPVLLEKNPIGLGFQIVKSLPVLAAYLPNRKNHQCRHFDHPHAYWQTTDEILRFGESRSTYRAKADGKMILAQPIMVKRLSWSKRYTKGDM